jgi:hypothetical protein
VFDWFIVAWETFGVHRLRRNGPLPDQYCHMGHPRNEQETRYRLIIVVGPDSCTVGAVNQATANSGCPEVSDLVALLEPSKGL